ncbi:hypothetical protein SELMODRAFT_404057 [Selaginella moellendorffii]|uniref:Uncharacterized protein n=1 Tax=Selaginella moellendorffii TaxID=88036 RepID=D8QU52_SELML|nr:hypothetical protein SELMODRAFT_404057 [Selaginella moellendorffii]
MGALRARLRHEHCQVRLCEEEGHQNQRERVLAFSDSAECYLRLGRYEQCIDAASAALAMDPTPCQEHPSKSGGFDQASVLRVVVATLERRPWGVRRQSRGPSRAMEELSNFLRAWSDGEEAPKIPEFAEFVGQVEVKMCEAEPGATQGTICDERDQARRASHDLQPGGLRESLVCEVAGTDREIPGMELFRSNWATPETWSRIRSDESSAREELQGIEENELRTQLTTFQRKRITHAIVQKQGSTLESISS